METVRFRVYWNESDWKSLGIKVADPANVCMVIGYMTDLPRLEQANTILLNNELKNIRNYIVARDGEAEPWGFRRNRYFRQTMRRTNGG